MAEVLIRNDRYDAKRYHYGNCPHRDPYQPSVADSGTAEEVRKELRRNGVDVTVDNSSERIGYKIRKAQMEKIPYMLVLGAKEAEEGNVSVRSRYLGDEGVKPLGEFVNALCEEIRTKEIRKIEKKDA
jgi:threonyl-tRNA synthetase